MMHDAGRTDPDTAASTFTAPFPKQASWERVDIFFSTQEGHLLATRVPRQARQARQSSIRGVLARLLKDI